MMNKFFILILIVFITNFSFSMLIFAQEKIEKSEKTYFDEHARGWHWYETEAKSKEGEDEIDNDPVEQMNAIQATVKRALDHAILHPTKENVKNYIVLQHQVTERSVEFSKLWRAALLEEPELDFSLKHPTNNLARQVEVDQENLQQEEAIKQLAKISGLFFFYHSTCPYCRAFAPILKRLTDHYGIHVIAITTDGVSLPEFPHSYPNQGQAATFKVTVEPALFVVNPYTKKAVPVGYGLMSEMDLKRRMVEIAKGGF